MMKETYLGDGLYASFDGYQITLRAQRENGDHFVALEPLVLEAFFHYVESLKEDMNETPKHSMPHM
jgi:hypothetical protein